MVRIKTWLFITFSIIASVHANAVADNYVVVVVDDSGSMDEVMNSGGGRVRRMDAAKNALRTVLSNLPPNTKIGLLALNRLGADGNWLYPLSTADRDQLLSVVNELEADGGTPLGRAMKAGTDALLVAREKDPFGTFRLLVVTDGEATDAVILEQYLPDIVRRGIAIDVIGVDMQKDHSLATKVHQYRRADDAEALNQAVAAVFAESSAASDQGGESDFDWIASLPDEFAAEALAAVSKINNTPVGEQTEGASDFPAEPAQANGFQNPPPIVTNNTDSSVSAGIGTMCCCFGSVVFLGVVVLSVAQAAKKRRR